MRLWELEYISERFLNVLEEAETVDDPGGGAAVRFSDEGEPGFELRDLVVNVRD